MNTSLGLTHTQLTQSLNRLNHGRVLVVGDIAIDEMVYGHTARLSREAPVVLLHHHKTDVLLGCAGNAVHNIAKLNAKRASIVGLCGKDYQSNLLLEAMERDGVDTAGLVFDADRPTTTRTRISGTANQSVTQQIVRIDRESRLPAEGKVEQQLLTRLSELAPEFDAMLISDYGLGVMTDAVTEHCLNLCKQHHLLLAVDSHRPLSHFPGATVLTPNQAEAEANLGYTLNTPKRWYEGGEALLNLASAQNLLMTRGAEGMLLVERLPDKAIQYTAIPAFNRSEVFDVTGAGDTVVGTLILALASGVSLLEGSVLGNIAASIVVKRFGTATTSQAEIHQAIAGIPAEVLASIRSEIKPVLTQV